MIFLHGKPLYCKNSHKYVSSWVKIFLPVWHINTDLCAYRIVYKGFMLILNHLGLVYSMNQPLGGSGTIKLYRLASMDVPTCSQYSRG